uniref:Cobalamin biosynthesis protein CbiG n=1 Tax=Desulfovibrio sp. U5L TaxID=596152 RepID=I2PYE9_9BACT
MPAPHPAVYAVTEKGARLGRRLAARLGADLFVPERLAGLTTRAGTAGLGPVTAFASLGGLVAETFAARPAHVFVCACGIAVRAIAPHIRDKASDPAVVCVDDAGRFAVSLLAGHLGGANALAREVAAVIGAVPVVTTATDAAGAPAIELLARDLRLPMDNPVAARRVNGALAANEPVAVFDPLGVFTPADPDATRFFEWVASPAPARPGQPLVVVDWRLGPLAPDRLYLRPRVLVAGVGCRRGTPAEDILSLLAHVCREKGLAVASVGLVASIEAKRDEPGIREAAASLGAELRFFTAGELAGVTAPNPSERVAKHMGVGSVCEAAAMLASGSGKLLIQKARTGFSTVAVALAG